MSMTAREHLSRYALPAVVIDFIAILTDTTKPRQYWHDMKRYIQAEGFREASEKVRRLKMQASDGKQRATDAADTESILRIIQSVPTLITSSERSVI
jgi:DNA-damage-inducible protein D